MSASSSFGLGVFFCVVFADDSFSGALEHMMEEAEETEFQIRLVDILMRGKRFLAVIALDETFQLFLGCMFFQVGEDHLHLFTTFSLVLTGEG